MPDKSLQFHSGIDNSEFVQKIDEMIKNVEKLSSVTEKDAEEIVKSLKQTAGNAKEAADAYAQMGNTAVDAVNRQRTARGVELALTKSITNAETALKAAKQSMNVTYDEQVQKIREIEQQYTLAQQYLEAWKNSEKFDPTTYNQQVAALATLNAEIQKQKISVEAAKNTIIDYGTQSEAAINGARQAVRELMIEQDKEFQTKRAASEQERRTNELSAMSNKQLIDTYVNQRVAVRELEREIKRGNVTKQDELTSERAALEAISKVTFEKNKAMTMQRELLDMLMKENMATKEATAYKLELEKVVKEVGTAYRESTKTQTALTTGATQWGGIMSAVQGIAGAFTAAQGVMGLFAEKNEDLVKIQTKMQSAMSITMGMSQLANTLHATSAFRVTTLTTVTRAWTSVQHGLSAALHVSAGAAQAFTAAITVGLSVAITFIVAAINRLIQKVKSQKEEARALREEMQQVNTKFAEQSARVNELTSALKSSNTSYKAKAQALDELKKLVPEVTGSIDKQTGAVTYNKDAVDKYVKSLRTEIEAEVLRGKMKEAVTKQLTLMQDLEEKKNESLLGKNNRQLRKWAQEVTQLEIDLAGATNTVTEYEGQLTSLVSKLLEGDADEASRKKQQERLEKYKKEITEMRKEVEKMLISLDNISVEKAISELAAQGDVFNKSVDDSITKLIQGINAEKTLHTSLGEWRIKAIKDENEQRRKIIEKSRSEELQKVEAEKAKYLKAYGLTELPAEMQVVFDTLKKTINQYFDDQTNIVSNDEKKLGFSKLFGDIEGLSVATLERLIEQAKTYLETTSGLTVDEIDRIKQNIAKGEAQIRKANPFKALLAAYKEYKAAQRTEGGDDDEEAIKKLKLATSEVQSFLGDMFSLASSIGQEIGAEWTGAVENVGKALSSVFDAVNSDNLSSKITGIVSAALYAVNSLSDLINQKMLKNAETAAAQTETIANRIKQIAGEKGIGDSLFTDDMFNRVRQYKEAVNTALGQIQSSFDMFRKQQREQYDLLLGSQISDFDPLLGDFVERAFDLSADKFIEQNEAAYKYLSTLTKMNLKTAADIETALAELDAASKKTSGELGTAYLEQARTALEAALQYTQDLENAVSEMVGDVGDQVLDVILKARNEGTSAVADIAGAISTSLEDLISQQIWAATMGKVFSEFGSNISEAITNQDQGAITSAYAKLFDGIIQQQGEFYAQLDTASGLAKAAGLSIFGVSGDTAEEMQSTIDVMKTYLDGLQESLDSINIDALREELNSISIDTQFLDKLKSDKESIEKEIASLQQLEDEALQRGDETAADAYNKQIAEKQRILGEILTSMDAIKQDAAHVAEIEKQISDYDYAASNIDLVKQRIADMEKELGNYVGTLEYYDEKIAGINAEMKKMTAEELATEAGKARLEELKNQLSGFEGLRNSLNEMIFGDTEKSGSMVEGSISWLNNEISKLTTEMNNLSPEDFYGDAGASLKAKIDEYSELLKTMSDFYEVQNSDDLNLEGSINWLRDEISRLEEEKAALKPEDLTGAAGAALQAKIDEYTEQLSFLEDYYKAVVDAEKEMLDAALQEYETKENEKARIVKDYQDKINVLRKNGYEEEAELAAQALADYLSETALAALEGTKEYETIYENLTKVSIEEARKALAAYREMISGNTELTAEQKAQVLAELDEIQTKIDDLETTAAQKEFDKLKKKVEDIQSAIDSVASILESFGAGNLAEGLRGVGDIVGGIFSLVTALTSGGIVGILSSLSAIVTGIITVVGAIREAVGTQDYDTSGIEALAKEYDKLATAATRAAGAERTAIREAQQQNINARLAELQTLIVREQKKEKYWWDFLGLFSSDADKEKIAEWQAEYDSLIELQQQLTDDAQMQFFTTGFEDVSKSIAAIAADTTKTVTEMKEAVKQEVNSMISNMIQEFLRVEMLEKPFREAMAKIFSDSDNGKNINIDALKKFREDAIAMSEEYYEAIKPIFDVLGINTTSSAAASARQTIRSITEPQADIIVGRMHGMGITQTEMKDIQKGIDITLGEGLKLNREMLLEIREIKENTNELIVISKTLKDIKNNNGLYGTGLGV